MPPVAARCPHGQRGRQDCTLGELFVGRRHGVEQQRGRLAAEPEGIDRDRGQRWVQVPGDRHVVEADHGQVLGDPHPQLPGRAQQTDRHAVVGGEHGRRPRPLRQDREPRGVARRLPEIARFDAGPLRIQPGLPQRRLEAPPALVRIHVAGRTADHRDVAVAELQQVPRRVERAAEVVDRDGAAVVGLEPRIQEHDRQPLADPLDDLERDRVGRHEDQAVDPSEHRPRGVEDVVVVRMGAGEQDLVARLPRPQVDAPDDLGIEFAVEVRQQDPEGVAPARGQALRGLVRPVVASDGGLHDPPRRLAIDQFVVVEDARNSGDRDASGASDIADVRHGRLLGGGPATPANAAPIRRCKRFHKFAKLSTVL
jgi:hypothetical protein